MKKFIVYLIKPVLLGLLIALFAIVLMPGVKLPSLDLRLDSSQVDQNSFANAVRAAAPAVVNIYSQTETQSRRLQLTPQGLGSGIIMHSAGYVLTNYHVVKNADQIYIALQDGRWANADVIGTDPWTDLAVLHINLADLPVIPLALDRSQQVGDRVLAIGNPFNLGQTITSGIISATGRNGLSSGFQDFIQTDAAINQGNSGGALIDADGYLVGVNTANYQGLVDGGVGLNFAIPISLAHKIMQTLIKQGHIIRGHLGITGAAVTTTLARRLGLPEVIGVHISELEPGGPAANAGLRPNDVLVAINGQLISGTDMLLDAVAETPPNTEVNMTLIRQGQYFNTPITIGSKPPPLD